MKSMISMKQIFLQLSITPSQLNIIAFVQSFVIYKTYKQKVHMADLIHKVHNLILLLIRYSLIVTVIMFIPVPLSHYLSGNILSETQPSPLYEYFNYYNISTDQVIESVLTNVYIAEDKNQVKQWDVENAILWADALAFALEEQNVPVVKKVIVSKKVTSKVLKDVYEQEEAKESLIPDEVQDILKTINNQVQQMIPFISLTQQARQWIILALDSTPKQIKKQIKSLISQNPDDNFLVITRTPISLGKKSLKLDLPEFNQQQALQSLTEGLKLSEKQAAILLKQSKKSLLQLDLQGKQNEEFTIKSILDEDYHKLNTLSEKEQQILSQLCLKGKVKASKQPFDLSEYGVIIKNKHYQWKDEQTELNYELQKEILCGKQTPDVQTNQSQEPQTDKSPQNEAKSQDNQQTIDQPTHQQANPSKEQETPNSEL